MLSKSRILFEFEHSSVLLKLAPCQPLFQCCRPNLNQSLSGGLVGWSNNQIQTPDQPNELFMPPASYWCNCKLVWLFTARYLNTFNRGQTVYRHVKDAFKWGFPPLGESFSFFGSAITSANRTLGLVLWKDTVRREEISMKADKYSGRWCK